MLSNAQSKCGLARVVDRQNTVLGQERMELLLVVRHARR
jgi:hypothetical protein